MFSTISKGCWPHPGECLNHRCPVMAHGIGMGDEWPAPIPLSTRPHRRQGPGRDAAGPPTRRSRRPGGRPLDQAHLWRGGHLPVDIPQDQGLPGEAPSEIRPALHKSHDVGLHHDAHQASRRGRDGDRRMLEPPHRWQRVKPARCGVEQAGAAILAALTLCDRECAEEHQRRAGTSVERCIHGTNQSRQGNGLRLSVSRR